MSVDTTAAPRHPDGHSGKLVIVIPTYNERDNIARLIKELCVQFAKLERECWVLVVDDSSPDGTADVVHEAQKVHPNVALITGKKAGLGAAYIRGISYALSEMHADVVFEMDADFSHKPADVPRLLQEIDQGADFVIGSRYVVGGSIPKNWGPIRKLNSWGGNLVARYVAGLYPIRDCTAGFRAIRGQLLRSIALDKIKVQGYAFQVALLHEAVIRKAPIREIAVDFIDRTDGESKLGLKDIVEFVINAAWLRFRGAATFIKFLLVGASGVLVNLGAFTLLISGNVHPYIASPLAIQLAITSNFLLNNVWTFRWRQVRDSVQMRGLKFNVVSIVALLLSFTTFVIVNKMFPSLPLQIPQVLGIIPATIVNYLLNSYWTFRQQHSDLS